MSKLEDRIAELNRRRSAVAQMGGAERVAKQHARGKLDVRARIAALFNPGTFDELGGLAENVSPATGEVARSAPADGVVTGFGEIYGRPVACAAYDFTIYGGSIGPIGETKVTRLRELALRHRVPIVWLVDSAGARIHVEGGFSQAAMVAQFADSGYLFREQVVMSGVVPQVAAMVGPGAAGTAYIPGLADFVPMVKGTSSMAIGGPYLVKAVVGEDVTEEDLGGSKVHTEVSGVADLEVPDDKACLEAVRKYLGYFPSNCEELPPISAESAAAGNDQAWRAKADAALDKALPDNPRQAYAVQKVLEPLVDPGSLFEVKPRWARNMVTALARIGGYPVGIVANNPMYYAGSIDVNSSDKAARFINLCDAFNIPLVFCADTPGFMVGSKVEKDGIIRHGAKFLYAVSTATVPKLTVILRKAYGAGYYVMCGRAYEPDLILAWPTAEISVMGPEGMVGIAGRKVLAEAEDPAAVKAQMIEGIKQFIDIFRVAELGYVDDVVAPRETRARLIAALKRTRGKRVERPHRRREVSPV